MRFFKNTIPPTTRVTTVTLRGHYIRRDLILSQSRQVYMKTWKELKEIRQV